MNYSHGGIMDKLHLFLEKFNSNTFVTKDVRLLLKQMNDDVRQGIIALKKDDKQWFETYAFGLQELENACNPGSSQMRAGDWRQAVDDYSKVKLFVDEMEDKKIVTNVFWNVEGIVTFDIPDITRYRDFVYCKIRSYLEKLY